MKIFKTTEEQKIRLLFSFFNKDNGLGISFNDFIVVVRAFLITVVQLSQKWSQRDLQRWGILRYVDQEEVSWDKKNKSNRCPTKRDKLKNPLSNRR